MNNDNLDQMPDADLSALFAVECAGFVDEPNFPHMFWLGPDGCMEAKQTEDGEPVDFFATSADAVLPYLQKAGTPSISGNTFSISCAGATWCVVIEPRSWDDNPYAAEAPTFARAACIALLRAKRAEKGQP